VYRGRGPSCSRCAAIAAKCLTRTACTACRERNDGLYRVITYLVAKMVEELGIALLNSIVFGGCCRPAGRPAGRQVAGSC
jgi:hypothetical protein